MLTFDKNKDFISIIAPASACVDGDLKLSRAKEILEERGFKLLIDDKILSGDSLNNFLCLDGYPS